MNTLLKLTL